MIKRIFRIIIVMLLIGPLILALILPDTNNQVLIFILDLLISIIYFIGSILYEELQLKKEAKNQLKIEKYKDEIKSKYME